MMFIVFNCALLLMLVTALTFILKPLMAGNGQFLAEKKQIFLAVLFALLATILYLTLGAPKRLLEYYRSERLASQMTYELSHSPASLDRLANHLRQRVAVAPDSGKGWYWLARVEMAQQHYDTALPALMRAQQLLGQNPDITFQRAQALYVLHGEVFDTEIKDLLKQVLAYIPQHEGALLMLAEAAFREHDYRVAIQYWQRLLVQHGENTPAGKTLLIAIERASILADHQRPVSSAMRQHIAVPVIVTLQAHSLQPLPEAAAVFIFIKNTDTQEQMPLLVARKSAKDLPIHTILTEANAMMSSVDWSNIHTISISARLSLSGNALPSPGDINGSTILTKVGTIKKPVIISLNLK